MTEAELEQHLHDLYRSEDPPAVLTGRILAHARKARARTHGPWLQQRAALVSLCALLLAACAYIAIGVVHRRQVQAQRAQEAQARLAYALQITTGELNWAEAQIAEDMHAGQRGADR
ncbi:MAG: hypothetical protein EPN33_14570 [Acidobacteria bacterium]|nr:MAG: hypothetical protein EPN33_14570 [Acidobacteriota bacterium]